MGGGGKKCVPSVQKLSDGFTFSMSFFCAMCNTNSHTVSYMYTNCTSVSLDLHLDLSHTLIMTVVTAVHRALATPRRYTRDRRDRVCWCCSVCRIASCAYIEIWVIVAESKDKRVGVYPTIELFRCDARWCAHVDIHLRQRLVPFVHDSAIIHVLVPRTRSKSLCHLSLGTESDSGVDVGLM